MLLPPFSHFRSTWLRMYIDYKPQPEVKCTLYGDLIVCSFSAVLTIVQTSFIPLEMVKFAAIENHLDILTEQLINNALTH